MAKYKYENRIDKNDVPESEKIIKAAIGLDRYLFEAWSLYENILHFQAKREEAYSVLKEYSKIAREINNKKYIAYTLVRIGSDEKKIQAYNIYSQLGDKKGVAFTGSRLGHIDIKYLNESLEIYKKLKEFSGAGVALWKIALSHFSNYRYDLALGYFKELNRGYFKYLNKHDKADINSTFAYLNYNIGNFKDAFDLYLYNIKLMESVDDKLSLILDYFSFATLLFATKEYSESINIMNKSLEKLDETIESKYDGFEEMYFKIHLYICLSSKLIGLPYDVERLNGITPKSNQNNEYEINFRYFELFEEKSSLQTAYSQVQDKASAMEEKLAKKSLSYPIPKAIVEEWEKVK